jgi:hypothetical protein
MSVETGRKTNAMRILWLSSLIGVWTVVFVTGCFVNTFPVQDRIQDADYRAGDYFQFVYDWFLMIFFWTWSNLVFICCLASIVGEYGRAATSTNGVKVNYRAAIIRGFFVYLLMLTGQLVVSGSFEAPAGVGQPARDNLVSLDTAHFFRLTAFASLVSFMIGYNPQLFSLLISKFERMSGVQTDGAPLSSKNE